MLGQIAPRSRNITESSKRGEGGTIFFFVDAFKRGKLSKDRTPTSIRPDLLTFTGGSNGEGLRQERTLSA